MSKKTKISRLPKNEQNYIKEELLQNGYSNEDIILLFNRLTLADISDIIDIDVVAMWILKLYTTVGIIL